LIFGQDAGKIYSCRRQFSTVDDTRITNQSSLKTEQMDFESSQANLFAKFNTQVLQNEQVIFSFMESLILAQDERWRRA
jgi:hypothetical protein